MSGLQQLQITYDKFQDRLILIIYTQDFQEYRFWITRNCVKYFWEVLAKLLAHPENSSNLNKQENQVTMQIAKEKEQTQASANKFANKISVKPLGNEPLLITKIEAKLHSNGSWQLKFDTIKQSSIEFGGNAAIALALKNMLKQTAEAADWQLKL